MRLQLASNYGGFLSIQETLLHQIDNTERGTHTTRDSELFLLKDKSRALGFGDIELRSLPD